MRVLSCQASKRPDLRYGGGAVHFGLIESVRVRWPAIRAHHSILSLVMETWLPYFSRDMHRGSTSDARRTPFSGVRGLGPDITTKSTNPKWRKRRGSNTGERVLIDMQTLALTPAQ